MLVIWLLKRYIVGDNCCAICRKNFKKPTALNCILDEDVRVLGYIGDSVCFWSVISMHLLGLSFLILALLVVLCRLLWRSVDFVLYCVLEREENFQLFSHLYNRLCYGSSPGPIFCFFYDFVGLPKEYDSFFWYKKVKFGFLFLLFFFKWY